MLMFSHSHCFSSLLFSSLLFSSLFFSSPFFSSHCFSSFHIHHKYAALLTCMLLPRLLDILPAAFYLLSFSAGVFISFHPSVLFPLASPQVTSTSPFLPSFLP